MPAPSPVAACWGLCAVMATAAFVRAHNRRGARCVGRGVPHSELISGIVRRRGDDGQFSAGIYRGLERNRENAWQILRDTLRWLASVLIVITVAGEAVLGVWVWLVHDDPHVQLLAGLTAVFLPYLIVVCVTAVASAALQAWADSCPRRFRRHCWNYLLDYWRGYDCRRSRIVKLARPMCWCCALLSADCSPGGSNCVHFAARISHFLA